MTPEERTNFVSWFKANEDQQGSPDWEKMVGLFQKMDTGDAGGPGLASGIAGQLSHGIRQGVYDLAHAPTSLANLGLAGADLVAEQFDGNVDYRFKRPLEVAAPQLDARITQDIPYRNAPERYANQVGKFLGGDLPLTLTGIGAAPKVAKLAKKPGGFIKTTAETLRDKPGKILAGEATASVAAAGGSQAAKDADLGPAGQVLGGMAAALTPSAIMATPLGRVTRAVGRGAARTADLPLEQLHNARRATMRKDAGQRETYRDRVGGAAIDRREGRARRDAEERVHKFLKKHIDADAVEKARESVKISDYINEGLSTDGARHQITLAEATQSPSLLGEQDAIMRNMTGKDFDDLAAGTAVNEVLIQNKADEIVPQGTARNITDPLEDVVTAKRAQISRISESLDAKEKRLIENLQQAGTMKERGELIRETIETRKAAVKELMSDKAQSLGLNSRASIVVANEVRDDLRAYIDSIPLEAGPVIPSQLKQIISKGKAQVAETVNYVDQMLGVGAVTQPPEDVWSITNLEALRTNIGQEIRKAQTLPARAHQAKPLQELLKVFDDSVSTVLARSKDPTLADRWKSYRDIYKTEYVDPYKKGAVADITAMKRAGEYRIKSEKVAATLFDETPAEDVMRIIGGEDLPGMEAIEAAATDSLYHAAFNPETGDIRPGAIERWRSKNEDVLAQFPEVAARAADAEVAVRSINDRRAVLAERKLAFNTDKLVKDITAVSKGSPPETVIADALTDTRKMRELVKAIKEPESLDALKRLVWEDAMKTGVLNPGSLYVFGDNARSSLDMLLKAMLKNGLVVPPKFARMPKADSLAALEDRFGVSIDQFFNRWFQVESGRVSGRTTAVNLLGKMSRRTQKNMSEKMFQSLVNDPSMAETVAHGMGRPLKPFEVKRLGAWLVVNGLAPFGDDEEEEYNPLRVTVNPAPMSRAGGE